jgi:superfamily II DNA or RNA helicase
MRLFFDAGTLILRDVESYEPIPPPFDWDDRVNVWRAMAYHYRAVREFLRREGIEFENRAPFYRTLTLTPKVHLAHRPYQEESLAAWEKAGRRGVIVIPTGTGKTFIALHAIARTARSALVVAPTIDLMNQWYDEMAHFFDAPIGILGGGYHEVHDLTVTTYHSAYDNMDQLGNRFGLLVFDEAHHLPGEMWSHIAEMAIAPYRLGLTATPEREDGRHERLDDLIGSIIYRKGISEMSGEYLSEYEVKRVKAQMVKEERAAYQTAREEFSGFLNKHNLSLGKQDGWQRFLQLSSQSQEGRRAMLAYRRARQIALGTAQKLRLLEDILRQHPRDRVLIFTSDNDTVYAISQEFLIPAITHQTKTKERKEILEKFNRGEYLAVVTSKVLNEGVNIPDANVAVILSGSGSVREHVQRLGRILRRKEGKQAVLYEIVTQDTVEDRISERRRRHEAYERGKDEG